MALETLKGFSEIGGFKVVDLDAARESDKFRDAQGDFDWVKFDEYRKDYPVSICHRENMISFRIQNGPIKEVGVNGCQVDTLLHAAMRIINEFNRKLPCIHNFKAMEDIQDAIKHLEDRKRDRESRGVESLNQQ